MTATLNRVKAAKKATRKIRLITPETETTPAVVRIEAGRKVALYSVKEIENELGVGRAFQIREIGTKDAETYSCIATGDEQTCDCIGHQKHQRCKHADGLAALVIAGRI